MAYPRLKSHFARKEVEVTPRDDLPSPMELKKLSLAIYNYDPDSAEACRDAALLAIVAQLLERRVPVDEAIASIVGLQRSDFSSGDGRLVVGNEEIRLRLGWLSATMRWLVFRGFRKGPLFFAVHGGAVVFESLSTDEVRTIIERRSAE